jgi:hypothetical protein
MSTLKHHHLSKELLDKATVLWEKISLLQTQYERYLSMDREFEELKAIRNEMNGYEIEYNKLIEQA